MSVQITTEQAEELGKCYANPKYFINNYVHILDAVQGQWIKFGLWPDQVKALNVLRSNQLSIILKARQLGATWLVLAYALWLVLFRPAAVVLLFSRRDAESTYLLGDDRVRGMWRKLPEWMRSGHTVTRDSAHEWGLDNGSVMRAFPSSAGDSYNATLAIVDEADLVADLNRLMRAVKPTIDNGGKMVLLSRADKKRPVSIFKSIFRGAMDGKTLWKGIFMPWYSHPARTLDWYEEQARDIMARTGTLDDLYEQYPATIAEALAPRTLDKRIPLDWLVRAYEEMEGNDPIGMTGLTIYKQPQQGFHYVIGADPAEGNPTSDDSAATIMERSTGEEVGVLAAKLQPATFAGCLDVLSNWYNNAPILVERNNHGHAVLLWLNDNASAPILNGLDNKPGWHTSSKSKAILYSTLTDAFRENEVITHSFDTHAQLASIEGSTLSAPEEEHDDRAVSYALAWQGVLAETWAVA